MTGVPATGRTEVAEFLSRAFPYPLVSRGLFTERLADCLGWNSVEDSKLPGSAGYALLYAVVDELLSNGVS